jgi:glycosidase
MTNLIALYSQSIKPTQGNAQAKTKPEVMPQVSSRANGSNLLANFLTYQASINAAMVKPVQAKNEVVIDYKNDLKTLFKDNKSKTLAIVPRTFNAKDTNGDAKIDGNEEHGTFLNAIERLDEVKSQGFNTLHVLPIHPPGKKKAMGTAGSLYSPADLLEIDPVLGTKDDFKKFINEAHKRGIRILLDLPSCASYDLFEQEPDIMAKERDGLAKTPQGWNDIRMFQPWEDEGKRTLNPKLLNLHKQYVDMCVDLGVDGIRADVARAKPTEFWDILIPYSRSKDPEFGWLAEAYTYEDASPQANMPYDRPEDSLRAGFESYYGQYHIFHEWKGAKDLNDFVKDNLDMSYDLAKGKSVLGSFATHDDISPMFHGGVDYCNLTTGLQATLPMLNPYIVDGFQSGDNYVYPYEHQKVDKTATSNNEMTVHRGKLDIFNLSRKPGGKHPEIGEFMAKAFEMRDKNVNLISEGTFIELDKEGDSNDQIITFARHLNGKTLLVVANKNVNRSVAGTIMVPTLKAKQKLENLLPSYGGESVLQAADGKLNVDLGPARIHVFEIDTPNIERNTLKVYKQHL